MSKLTKAQEAMILDLRQRAALHFTPEVKKDVQLPERGPDSWEKETRGYDFYPNGHVVKGVTKWGGHIMAECDAPWPVPDHFHGSQGRRAWFSTRLLALRASRNQAEREAAVTLEKIDAMIEAEEAKAMFGGVQG